MRSKRQISSTESAAETAEQSKLPPPLTGIAGVLQYIEPFVLESLSFWANPDAVTNRAEVLQAESMIAAGFDRLAVLVKEGHAEAGKAMHRANCRGEEIQNGLIEEPGMQKAIRGADRWVLSWDEHLESDNHRKKIKRRLKELGINTEGSARTFKHADQGDKRPRRFSFGGIKAGEENLSGAGAIKLLRVSFETAARIAHSMGRHYSVENSVEHEARVRGIIDKFKLPIDVETFLAAARWTKEEMPERAWDLLMKVTDAHPERIRECRMVCIVPSEEGTAAWLEDRRRTEGIALHAAVKALREGVATGTVEAEIRGELKKQFLAAIPSPLKTTKG